MQIKGKCFENLNTLASEFSLRTITEKKVLSFILYKIKSVINWKLRLGAKTAVACVGKLRWRLWLHNVCELSSRISFFKRSWCQRQENIIIDQKLWTARSLVTAVQYSVVAVFRERVAVGSVFFFSSFSVRTDILTFLFPGNLFQYYSKFSLFFRRNTSCCERPNFSQLARFYL